MYIRSCGIVSELYATIMRQILSWNISPADSVDVARKIRQISHEDWKTAMCVANRGNYGDCDFNLIYLFIVHSLHPRDQPANGWGNIPSESHIGLGDDIERMRDVKECLIKQDTLQVINKERYIVITDEALQICKRIDNINPAIVSSYYVELRRSVLTQILDETIKTRYKHAIKQMCEKQADMQIGQTHFARMCKIVLELNPSILQEILQEQLPINECINKAPNLRVLRTEQIDIINNDVPHNGYKNCDTTLMYTLLRNLCKKIPRPKSGWGKKVNNTDVGIGDDIERIRQRRNEFGHSPLAYLCTAEYNTLIHDSMEICRRMDATLPSTHSAYMAKTKPNFLPKLELIKKECNHLNNTTLNEYIQRLDEKNKVEMDTRKKIDHLSIQMKLYHEEQMEAGKKNCYRLNTKTKNCVQSNHGLCIFLKSEVIKPNIFFASIRCHDLLFCCVFYFVKKD